MAGSGLGSWLPKSRSCSPRIDTTWKCTWGTSSPASMSPMRTGLKPAICALPIACAVVARWASRSGSTSSQWSISSRGTTNACPGRSGRLERNATHWSSFQTNSAGNSPAIIRLNTLATCLGSGLPVEEPDRDDKAGNPPRAHDEQIVGVQTRTAELEERPDQRIREVTDWKDLGDEVQPGGRILERDENVGDEQQREHRRVDHRGRCVRVGNGGGDRDAQRAE